MVGQCPGDCLADPPARVGRELVTPLIVELFHRPHQTDVSFLHQIPQRHLPRGISFGYRDYQAKVRLQQFAACGLSISGDALQVAAFYQPTRRTGIKPSAGGVAGDDPLGEIDLGFRGEQRDPADLLKVHSQRFLASVQRGNGPRPVWTPRGAASSRYVRLRPPRLARLPLVLSNGSGRGGSSIRHGYSRESTPSSSSRRRCSSSDHLVLSARERSRSVRSLTCDSSARISSISRLIAVDRRRVMSSSRWPSSSVTVRSDSASARTRERALSSGSFSSTASRLEGSVAVSAANSCWDEGWVKSSTVTRCHTSGRRPGIWSATRSTSRSR